MPLARVPSMGWSLSTAVAPLSKGLSDAFAVMEANRPYLEAYKAAYGIAPVGQLVTLSNGVQGHFTGEIDPTTGQPIFSIDFTPTAFHDQAIANSNAQKAGAPPPYPQPVVVQPPAPPVFPGQPPPGYAPPMATSSSSSAAAGAPKPFLGIPPLALVAGGGLLIFLLARRL